MNDARPNTTEDDRLQNLAAAWQRDIRADHRTEPGRRFLVSFDFDSSFFGFLVSVFFSRETFPALILLFTKKHMENDLDIPQKSKSLSLLPTSR
jgi:hypothetical protein